MIRVMVTLLGLSIACCLSATAQNYNYSYGNSRVVNQNQTGLSNPSSTYIGTGTMSQSAQGLSPGTSTGVSNPLLPRVKMGANIATPGDNLYQPKPAVQAPNLPAGRMGAYVGTPGDNLRSDINYYTPGQNLLRNQNPSQPPQFMYKPGSGGTATYADQTYSSGGNDGGARRF